MKIHNRYMLLIAFALLFIVASIGLSFLQINRVAITQITDIKAVDEIDEGYIYFGRPTCPSCRLFEPIIEVVAQQKNTKIHYFNSDYFRKETNISEDELKKVFEKYDVIRIPLLVYMKDSEVYEAFGAELSGNKDQSMVYKDVSKMMDGIHGGKSIRLDYFSAALLCSATIICQFLMIKTGVLNRKSNLIFLVLCIVSSGLLLLWYYNFKNSGLQIFADDMTLAGILILSILMNGVFYFKNQKKYINQGGQENEKTI